RGSAGTRSGAAPTTPALHPPPQKHTQFCDGVRKGRGGRPPPPPNLHVAVGGALPASMELYDLPPNIAADIPATKLYKYTLVQNQVVIVDPTKMKVVDIIRP